LGGMLMSAMSVMMWMSFLNGVLVRSSAIYDMELYGGLLMFAGAVARMSGFCLFDIHSYSRFHHL
jgi:hypothetical protein